MPLIASDALWFRRHPEREYRLRLSIGDECRPYRNGETGWTIIRREDGVVIWFGCTDDLPVMEATDDQLRHAFNAMRAVRQPHLQ